MKISLGMINWLEVQKEQNAKPPVGGEGGQGAGLLAPYMEYPVGKDLSYVMQWHCRGRSVHTDWRMEANDHLVGWTVLDPGGVSESIDTLEDAKKAFNEGKASNFKATVKNRGFRAETKARQPKVWLKVEGIVGKGKVGATKEHQGVIYVVDTGRVYFGTQKPYFHEYFIKSNKDGGLFSGKDWTRVVVRAVNVQVIDPQTKTPKEGEEIMWRVLVPGDQTPYALDRGFKKKWIPPKGYIPVPPDWRKGDKYAEWEAWVKEAWAGKTTTKEEKTWSLEGLPFAGYKDFADCVRRNKHKGDPKAYCGSIKHQVEGSGARFTAQLLSYMGQVVVRGIPNMRWFLRLKEGDKIYSWVADTDFTRFRPVAMDYEGTVSDRWFDFEGKVPPNSPYNPSKTLTAKMEVIDSGPAQVDRETVEGADVLTVHFHGKGLTGRYTISQEEKGSHFYTIEKLSREELSESEFVLQTHEIETSDGLKKHWDIRLRDGFEFNLYDDPLSFKTEGTSTKAVYKRVANITPWMDVKEPRTKMMVGSLRTFVSPVDKGGVNLIEVSPPNFVSMQFSGEKLKGYYVYIEKDGAGKFEKARLPHALSRSGDPAKGDYFVPFRKEQKQGWDYYFLELYDMRLFTRCVDDPQKYLPKLSEKPKEILEVSICLYSRPGTVHGARVSKVKVSDEWTEGKAVQWIKSNGLQTWAGDLIREKEEKKAEEVDEATVLKKTFADSILTKVVQEELAKQREIEADKLDMELKKKKLELIDRWLKGSGKEEEEEQ